jgi:hypothetical protein
MEPIISVRGLSKRYRLGQRQSYGNLRESIASKFKAPRFWRGRDHKSSGDLEPHVWALNDVSFDV